MISVLLLLEVVMVMLTSLVYWPVITRFVKSNTGRKKILMLAWTAMVIGQYQIFAHDHLVQSLDSLTTGAYYQLGWMAFALTLTLFLMLGESTARSFWKYPILAFFVYIFLAFSTASFSEAAMMTVYRSGQVATDFLLIMAAYTMLLKSRTPELLVQMTVFWLVLLIVIVAIGAVLAPESAYVVNEGALGRSLRGAYPMIHQNELGLMAAIGTIVSVVQYSSSGISFSKKVFWLCFLLLAATVLFLTQARTSLAGTMLALFLAGFLIRRLRWLPWLVAAMTVVVLSYYWLAQSGLGVEDDVARYLRRGVTDEQLKTLSGRTEMWDIGLEMLKDAPVLGHGFAAGVRYEGEKYGLYKGTNMHSAHMQVLVDMGFLGYAIWLVFVFGMAAAIYRNYRYSVSRGQTGHYSVLAVLVMVLILFRSFLGHVLVAHQFNLMIYLALYIFAAVNTSLFAVGTREKTVPGSMVGREGRVTGGAG
jgi:O-antigen ligase